MFLPENLLDRRGHECELELRLALAPMDMFVTMDVAFILFQILDEGRGLSIKSYVAVRADLRSLAVSMARVQISSANGCNIPPLLVVAHAQLMPAFSLLHMH